MPLGRRLIIVISALFLVGVFALQVLLYNVIQNYEERALLSSAEHVRNVLMATRRIYHHQFLDSALPLDDKTLGFLPAHAMSLISRDFVNWDNSGFSFNNVSDRPRNPQNKADRIERQAIAYFRAHPKETQRFVKYTAADGKPYFHFSQPIWMEKYCITCHGSRAAAPPTIRARYTAGYNYKAGDLAGILSIKIPRSALTARIRSVFLTQLLWSLSILFLMGLAILWTIRRHVTQPLEVLEKGINQISAGNLTHRIPGLSSEFGKIGKSFNKMMSSLDSRTKELSASEQRFRYLVKTATDAIVLTDENGRLLLWNEGAEKIFGYTAEEMLGEPITALIPADMRDRHQVGMERVSRGEPPQYIGRVVELQALNKTGCEFPVEISLNSWQGQGEEHFHVAIIRDITKRKEDLKALQDKEILFHTMVDWASDWEYWIKPDGTFNYITPSVEKLTGYGAEEFKTNPALIGLIVHPEDRRPWERHLAEHLPEQKNETEDTIVLRIVKKDGEPRWFSHICRPVFSGEGEYLGRRVTMQDITDQKGAEDKIRNLAYFDPLTQLPNRRLLMDRLGHALNASSRNHQYGAVLILDLDHFKDINDTQGHDIGDKLLIEVGQRLAAIVRQEDTVSRLGGDEFVILFEGLGAEERLAAAHIEHIAEKIRLALSVPYRIGGSESEYLSTPSIGVTLFLGVQTSVEILLKQADVALYRVKDAGRNGIRFFNPAMQAAIEARTALENAIRRGMANQEFRLYFQPQVDREGRILAAEALLRWELQDGTLALPDTFIPIAEESGLIVDLGQQVLDMACRQLKSWRADPRLKAMKLAVNVSARQFHHPDFIAQVRRSLDASGVNPAGLTFELTESVLLSRINEGIERMNQLKSLGISFALDDFGTGYSSLSYLKQLPVDQVKIDKSFIQNLGATTNDETIVRAILAMCNSLNLQVVAEGVETQYQRDFLDKHGCLAFQGYLFAKPMPIEEWDRLSFDT